MSRSERILWIDGVGAAVVGVITLLLHEWLSTIGGLPQHVLVGVGIANLAYAGFSRMLWTRPTRSLRLIGILVAANLCWSLICIGLLLAHWQAVNAFAILHLGGEALYVGVLAILEWRCRKSLAGVGAGRTPGSATCDAGPKSRKRCGE